jgi:hypothetical protein
MEIKHTPLVHKFFDLIDSDDISNNSELLEELALNVDKHAEISVFNYGQDIYSERTFVRFSDCSSTSWNYKGEID